MGVGYVNDFLHCSTLTRARLLMEPGKKKVAKRSVEEAVRR